MTYDAVLAARRGLGVEEQRLAPPALLEAVYWARYAEAEAPHLADLREVVGTDPPDSLQGPDRTQFIANRTATRAALRELEDQLYPADEEDPA